MNSKPQTQQKRYRAFISYAHADQELVHGFVKRLERFPIPRSRFRKDPETAHFPARLFPFFLDQFELAASGSLKTEVEQALADSEYLIVMCSPAAAASQWVNAEINYFRERHGSERIRAVILSGDPAADFAENRDLACFPPALLMDQTTGKSVGEPIAADLRPGQDGEKLALLKVVAGLLGVGLDDIVRRDDKRKRQNVIWITALAGMIGLFLSTAAIATWFALQDAERSRADAEDLIEFMLTDLTAKLKDVGQLSVLTSVGERAGDYYSATNPTDLTPARSGRRSRAMHLLGEALLEAGDFEDAQALATATYEATEAALIADPQSLDRMFEHAQSTYWMGGVHYALGQYDESEQYYRAYYSLAEAMTVKAPGDPKYRKEAATAYQAMGSLLFDARETCDIAQNWYEKSTNILEDLLRENPDNSIYRIELAGAYGLIGDTWFCLGDRDLLRGNFERQLEFARKKMAVLQPLIADPYAAPYRALVHAANGLAAEGYALYRLGRLAEIEPALDPYLGAMMVLLERSAGYHGNVKGALEALKYLIDSYINFGKLDEAEALLKHYDRWLARRDFSLDTQDWGGGNQLVASKLHHLRIARKRGNSTAVDEKLADLEEILRIRNLPMGTWFARQGFDVVISLYRAEAAARVGDQSTARRHLQAVIDIYNARIHWRSEHVIYIAATRAAYEALGNAQKAAALSRKLEEFGVSNSENLL